MNPFLELTQLGKSYDSARGPAVIVQDFNLHVSEGEFVCIIGHSGCGKSTVLSIVMGLNEATEGGVILDRKEIAGPGLDRGVVFQSPALLPWLTARQNVLLAIDQVSQRLKPAARRELAEKYLALVGLENVADCYPSELSAGMRQRVGIARAFAVEPKVLLLDEPFSLLDVVTRMELQDELIRLWDRERKTVLMVTHDVDEALLLADRIVLMTNGPAATVGDIIAVPLARPRQRFAMVADPMYQRTRNELLWFLEKESRFAGAAEPTREKALTPYFGAMDLRGPVKISDEELFVIEKYTGFNRFRKKYRKQRPPMSAMECNGAPVESS